MEASISSQSDHEKFLEEKLDKFTVFPIENLCIRFPSVFDIILNYLDKKSLINCRLVNTILKDGVDNHRPFWKSIIQNYNKKIIERGIFDEYRLINSSPYAHWSTFLGKLII